MRFQFSLRLVFTLMTLLSVGLVVYRWPWVEDHGGGSYSTYRRGWNGKKLHHGRSRWEGQDAPSQRHVIIENWHENGRLRRNSVYELPRELVQETHFFQERGEHAEAETLWPGKTHGRF